MKAASKVAITALGSILLLGSSVNLAAEAASSHLTKQTAAKETTSKAPNTEEKSSLKVREKE
ncbi:hypothetical protein PAV_1c04430 [Paenibacillus alvei DSM 29]|uniref:hypothetical protein n=1 Tax=Paenibacillus alvei TaxID=44250 RepID=UPI00028973C6|nr:hypothetical protein [Paenibacillus alvei]EJW19463.1 hypothetical protein PAV_1c04430 [Paenibacillus alvei DSM 29]